MVKVTVWNEYVSNNQKITEVYPEGIHKCIGDFLGKETDFSVKTATLQEEEHGLTEDVLNNTDVLLWWGHVAHDKVSDEVVERIYQRVLKGMGIIFLHSSHLAKPFVKLMGTSCSLKWHEEGEKERIWTVSPNHPITTGVPEYFEIEQEEMYGEFFDIPQPDELIFTGWFKTGYVFRSGCCWNRGYGKVFYFQPGHETYPVYYNENIQKVIINAVRWANPVKTRDEIICPNAPSLE